MPFECFYRKGKRLKLTDLCFMIHHHDSFLLGGEGKILPKKGCLQISPANLWTNITRYEGLKMCLYIGGLIYAGGGYMRGVLIYYDIYSTRSHLTLSVAHFKNLLERFASS